MCERVHYNRLRGMFFLSCPADWVARGRIRARFTGYHSFPSPPDHRTVEIAPALSYSGGLGPL